MPNLYVLSLVVVLLNSHLTYSIPVSGFGVPASGGSASALGDTVVNADNIKKLTEIYGIATQIMNIGGEVLNGGRGGGSGGGYSSSSGGSGMGNSFNANNFGRSNFGGSRFDGNSIGSGSDIVRPTFRGVSNYNSAPSISPSRFGGDRLPESGSGYGSPNLGGNSNFGGGYDGGPVKSARMSGWEHLLNGFLGSSFGGGGSTGNSYSSSATASRPEFFNSRAPNEYETPRSTKGSDIQSLLSALQRSGASKSEPERGGESTNFLSQLLGGK